jgi:multidrug efflux pump subunit AcrB
MRKRYGAIAWMAANPVAANIFMLICLIGGGIMCTLIKQEIFPEFESDTVAVSVSYPGSSPEEIEQGIVLAIEERVSGLDGVKKITSSSTEGVGTVTVEAVSGTDMNRFAQDIKSEIDRITSFPEESETPQVTVSTRRRQVLSIVLYGELEERVLRELAETVRDELLRDDGITQVELGETRSPEIAVEISEAALRAHGLTLQDVASTIGATALELPGGSLKTSQGEILVRIKDRKDYGSQFARLPIITTADGAMVRLEDLGAVRDDLDDSDIATRYNNKPAVLINVFRIGDQTPVGVSEAVHRQLDRLNLMLPPGVFLAIQNDSSDVFSQRMDLLTRNGLMGLILVFLLLALFLEFRLAFWVSMGIPISVLGSFLILPWLGVSFNMVTMFAFIVTLGIVVDDAIVVGENINQFREQGLSYLDAAVQGTRQVGMPVIFSVLTNMIAFAPMLFVPGTMGKIYFAIPLVVICVFAVSLLESLFVLPAHLGHQNARTGSRLGDLSRLQSRFSVWFLRTVSTVFGPMILTIIRFRYLTVAVSLTILLVIGGYVASGRMGMVPFPKVESDYAFAEVAMPFGSPVERTEEALSRLVVEADKLAREHGGDKLVLGILSLAGSSSGAHQGSVRVYLTPPEERPLSTAEFTRLWRNRVGQIIGAEYVKYESDRGGPGSGAALTVQLSHRSPQVLEQAAADLATALGQYAQVSDIDDGFSSGKTQLDFHIRPEGRSLGLTSQSLGRQVRASFYGAEALRQQRGRDEIKVMVRLPESERTSLSHVENFMVRAPAGTTVPLREVADVTLGKSYTSIDRQDGRRVITVTADVTPPSEAGTILGDVKKSTLSDLRERYPGLTYSFEGKQADIQESMQALTVGLAMAVLGVFMLLAIPLKSYAQPLIIMTSIPFGIVGAVLGHLLMDYSLSIMSMFGIVALSGVVVNDSLVLIDCANGKRRLGMPPLKSVHMAAVQRFRPILLTTVTTFGGLAPMIFETSRQARFLIPMALSLGFGILFATFITLAIVPSLYMILEDTRRFVRAWRI